MTLVRLVRDAALCAAGECLHVRLGKVAAVLRRLVAAPWPTLEMPLGLPVGQLVLDQERAGGATCRCNICVA